MDNNRFLTFGPNAGYLTEQYQLYLTDPSLVDPQWIQFFSAMDANENVGAVPAWGTDSVKSDPEIGPIAVNGVSANGAALHKAVNGHKNGQHSTLEAWTPPHGAGARTSEDIALSTYRAHDLISGFRRLGHLAASINPLKHTTVLTYGDAGRPQELSLTFYGESRDPSGVALSNVSFARTNQPTAEALLGTLEQIYCTTIGFEFMHLGKSEERTWLATRIEARSAQGEGLTREDRKRILTKLVAGDLLESELHRKYVGTKRFSLEGSETLIPALDALLAGCAKSGVREVVFGMAHRGRLNVLSNTLGKPLEAVFGEFQDQSMATVIGAGDVKYHLGFEGSFVVDEDAPVKLQMVPNPSHLEFVNPVAEGVARALQDDRYNGDRKSVLPVLMHGDSALAGQGVVFETIGYSLLSGYTTGGTIHIVINNQIGFTTTPDEARSTMYCTDIAKGFDCPVFHVNTEDPEGACWTMQLALEFRNQFGKDVFIDLVGYRKHGHNEGDDPSFTQPLTYAEIKTKRPVWEQYGATLIQQGMLTQEEVDEVTERYKATFSAAQERVASPAHGEACAIHGRLRIPTPETGVSGDSLKEIARSLVAFPDGFVPHPKLVKIIEKRVDTVVQETSIEWGVAEALAFGSLVIEGYNVRLSGQDCRRGTFSQRHIVLDNFESSSIWSPLASLRSDGTKVGRFDVFNSSLSETGVLGFEFGYAATAPKDLVIWEAQFGDFSNGAQVIIDQFIASSEAKWGQLSGVTLMLPHAYEGQGPEHSSARLERFLQLCGEGNMCVCYPSSSAQHFHLLRRQGLLELKRPLIIMTPKSLLRLPTASSSFAEFTSGSFKPIIEDDLSQGGEVRHVVLLTGKVFHDLMPALKELGKIPVKVVRIEQLHPFPQFEFKKVLKDVATNKVIWVQEEPQNMGAWSYVQPYLVGKLGLDAVYVGRDVAASTATGSPKRHASEQKSIVAEVLRLVQER